MLHHHNVTVIDQHLAGKENQGLQCFPKSIAQGKRVANCGSGLRRNGKIGNRNGRGIGSDHSFDAETKQDQKQGPTQSHRAFQDKIFCQTAEAVSPLGEAPPASQRNIKCCADREQGNETCVRQIQVMSNRRLIQLTIQCQ